MPCANFSEAWPAVKILGAGNVCSRGGSKATDAIAIKSIASWRNIAKSFGLVRLNELKYLSALPILSIEPLNARGGLLVGSLKLRSSFCSTVRDWEFDTYACAGG